MAKKKTGQWFQGPRCYQEADEIPGSWLPGVDRETRALGCPG
jgi:hypothetical protein